MIAANCASQGMPPKDIDSLRAKAVKAAWKIIPDFVRVAPADRRPTNALHATELYLNGKTTIDDMELSGIEAYRAAEAVYRADPSRIPHYAALACYLVTSHRIKDIEEAINLTHVVKETLTAMQSATKGGAQ